MRDRDKDSYSQIFETETETETRKMCIFETETETETRKMVETESLADLCSLQAMQSEDHTVQRSARVTVSKIDIFLVSVLNIHE